MNLEIKPAGERCPKQCVYCYQEPMRLAGNLALPFDISAIRRTVEECGPNEITLFGGEPLVAPIEDLDQVLALAHEREDCATNIQTAGELIDDDHIRLFKRYRTTVGISIDGPGNLNDLRRTGNMEQTREATAKTEAAIARLLRNNIPVSLIITLHRLNTGPRLPRLKAWIAEMVEAGVRAIRLHILEVDNPVVRDHYVLSNDEYLHTFLEMMEFEREMGWQMFDVSSDMRRMLAGDDGEVTCVWSGCDSYNTSAVYGVAPDGDLQNCGRTNKDGVNWQKAGSHGYERYLSLYNTPQEHGGCQGCRFFLMCRGNCPGTAIDGDWRNRSEFCSVWKGLYTWHELKMLQEENHPLSLWPDLKNLEAGFLAQLASGQEGSVATLLLERQEGQG